MLIVFSKLGYQNHDIEEHTLNLVIFEENSSILPANRYHSFLSDMIKMSLQN